MDEEIEQVWKEFWLPLLEKDGKIDMEQVKKELYDFRMVMKNASKVYEHITSGKISYANTSADAVISEADNSYFWLYYNGSQ